LDTIVVEGTSTGDLYLGPGHYTGTPLPGQAGNSAIAGHRTTYGAPFYALNELQTGDPVFVTTTQGRFCYQVTRQLVVNPSDVTVVAQTSTPELTLTTCNPRFSATSRLVVQASLVTPPAPSPTHLSLSGTGRSSTSPSGLAGEEGSWVGALIWGAACAVLGIAVWTLSRRLRRPWVTYAIGAVPLLVLLFVFFQNLAPLLPASF
jgi:sortase A